MPKESSFAELKIISKRANMLDERENSNYEKDDESIQSKKIWPGKF